MAYKEFSNYESALLLNRQELELAIKSCFDHLISADSLVNYRDWHNRLYAYLFRLAELKGFY